MFLKINNEFNLQQSFIECLLSEITEVDTIQLKKPKTLSWKEIYNYGAI